MTVTTKSIKGAKMKMAISNLLWKYSQPSWKHLVQPLSHFPVKFYPETKLLPSLKQWLWPSMTLVSTSFELSGNPRSGTFMTISWNLAEKYTILVLLKLPEQSINPTGGVSRTSLANSRGRIDCQMNGISTAPNQYIWKLGQQTLQTGSDYTIEVKPMFFGSQTTVLYIETSPAVDTSYTCIADFGGANVVSTTALLDIISKLC